MDDPADTRQALIAAATELFAEHGFDGTSLRAITQAAGANIAAVNYHFGSKEGLIDAVLSGLIEPITRERMARLDALDPASASVEDLLRALIEPMFGALQDPQRAKVALALAARIHLDPQRLAELMRSKFGTTMERFGAALATALPELDPAVIAWRFHFVIGSVLHVLQAARGVEPLTQQLGAGDLVGAREQLIAYAAAGMRAPAPEAA